MDNPVFYVQYGTPGGAAWCARRRRRGFWVPTATQTCRSGVARRVQIMKHLRCIPRRCRAPRWRASRTGLPRISRRWRLPSTAISRLQEQRGACYLGGCDLSRARLAMVVAFGSGPTAWPAGRRSAGAHVILSRPSTMDHVTSSARTSRRSIHDEHAAATSGISRMSAASGGRGSRPTRRRPDERQRDVTKEFRFSGESADHRVFRQAIAEPVRILTEERGEVNTRRAAGVDADRGSRDGSENFARGNEFSSVSLAVVRETGPASRCVSMLGGRILEERFWRRQGRRCVAQWRTRATVHGAATRRGDRRHRLLLSGSPKRGAAGWAAPADQDVRRFGTAAGELAMVACAVDAYVDVRTP